VALKIKETVELQHEMTLRGGFKVMVRGYTKFQLQQFYDRCTKLKPDPATGRLTMQHDDDLYNDLAPDFFIAGWTGLTANVLRELGVVADDEQPDMDDEGGIRYSVENARILWKASHADRFATPISNLSREMVTLRDLMPTVGSTP